MPYQNLYQVWTEREARTYFTSQLPSNFLSDLRVSRNVGQERWELVDEEGHVVAYVTNNLTLYIMH